MHTLGFGRHLLAAGLAVGAISGTPVQAASVSYFLTQANALPDGPNYMKVTIADDVVTPTANGNVVTFTVETLGALDSYMGNNFGIQKFGFNLSPGATGLSSGDLSLPTGWATSFDSNMDGFKKFDVVVGNGGGARLDPLVFSVDVAGDTINSYFDSSSGNGPSEGYAWYVAHVGFGTNVDPQSSYLGAADGLGGPPAAVPIPAAALLFGSAMVGVAGGVRRRTPTT